MEVKRICIYPKDIERITGKSNRSLPKNEKQLISVDEFYDYTGLKMEHVRRYITSQRLGEGGGFTTATTKVQNSLSPTTAS